MNKKKAIIFLSIIDILIILAGLSLSIYSYIYKVEYTVLNTEIAGYIFGIVVIFLGVRYFKSIRKLNRAISSPDVAFSWDNFKKFRKKRINHKRKLSSVR